MMIEFGRHKGETLETLLSDPDYCTEIVESAIVRRVYPELVALIESRLELSGTPPTADKNGDAKSPSTSLAECRPPVVGEFRSVCPRKFALPIVRPSQIRAAAQWIASIKTEADMVNGDTHNPRVFRCMPPARAWFLVGCLQRTQEITIKDTGGLEWKEWDTLVKRLAKGTFRNTELAQSGRRPQSALSHPSVPKGRRDGASPADRGRRSDRKE